MFSKLFAAIAVAGLIAAGSPAFAQKDRGVSVGTQPAPDVQKNDEDIRKYQDAVKYYQAGDFLLAKTTLDDFLGRQASNAGGNMLMGLVQIQLNDLEKARLYFRTAVKVDPKMVSSRGYLGAIEAVLGDAGKAQDQRAALVKMKADCKGSCPKAGEIDQAIQRIDDNLAAPKQ